MKYICIKDFKEYNYAPFKKGEICNGRLNDFSVNMLPNGYEYRYRWATFTFKKEQGYSWVLSDYFIPLAEWRNKQIEEILNG